MLTRCGEYTSLTIILFVYKIHVELIFSISRCAEGNHSKKKKKAVRRAMPHSAQALTKSSCFGHHHERNLFYGTVLLWLSIFSPAWVKQKDVSKQGTIYIWHCHIDLQNLEGCKFILLLPFKKNPALCYKNSSSCTGWILLGTLEMRGWWKKAE